MTTATDDDFVVTVNKGSASTWVPPEEDDYRGAIVDVIYIPEIVRVFSGRIKKYQGVKFVYELAQKRPDSDFNYTLSETFTLTWTEKSNLPKRLKGLKLEIPEDGQPFNFKPLVGLPVMVEVTHNPAKDGSGKIFANVGRVKPDKSTPPYRLSGNYKRRDPQQHDDEVADYDDDLPI